MASPAPSADETLLAQCLQESRLGFMAKAAAIARQLIDTPGPDSTPELRLDARIRLIWIQFQHGQHVEAGETARAAIQDALALQDQARESLARAYHARVLCEIDAVSAASDEIIAALRLARKVGDPLALSTALVVPAILCSRLGLYDTAVEMVDQAVKQIPPAWLEGEDEVLGSLLDKLMARRGRVPDLIASTTGRSDPFPMWVRSSPGGTTGGARSSS